MLLVLQLQDQADSEGPAWLGGQVMATFVNGWVTLEMRINLGYVSLIGYIYIRVYIYMQTLEDPTAFWGSAVRHMMVSFCKCSSREMRWWMMIPQWATVRILQGASPTNQLCNLVPSPFLNRVPDFVAHMARKGSDTTLHYWLLILYRFGWD